MSPDLGEHTLAFEIAKCADRLKLSGDADARRTVLQLLAAHREQTVAAVMTELAAPVQHTETEWLHQAVERLIGGEPLSYIAGHAGFRHLDLRVDRRALIPRPETESVVGEALARMSSGVAADIGTGTGAIALALRQEGQFSRVIGVDLSPDALDLASENGARLGLEVEWHLGDLVEPLIAAGERINLLVSNPPYLTEAEFGALDPSVRDFEPALALVSGRDGMLATSRLLERSRGIMAAGGWLVLEVDCRRAATAAALATELGWEAVQVRDDLFDRARILVARWGTAG